MEPSASQDHDILIELKTTMKLVRDDIKNLENGMQKQLLDHETRIRKIEDQTNRWIGKESIVGGLAGIIAGLTGAWLQIHK